MPRNCIFNSNFFQKGRGVKLGLYVFHHNNNFNLINVYYAKTVTIEYKKNYGSIDVLLCNFFFHNVVCANFLCPLGLCKFFLYKSVFHSPTPPPPPPPPTTTTTRSTGPSQILLPFNATSPTWNSGKGKERSQNKAFFLFIYLFKITK